MSANKETKTTIQEDENLDSGCLTESCELLSDELDPPSDTTADSDDKKVSSVRLDQPSEFDSGVICISDCLRDVTLEDCKTETRTVSSPERPQTTNLPPLEIFQQDDDGDTQLHIASVHGCVKSVGTIIRICPDMAWLDVPNDYGHTPLHLAVMSGNEVVTRMLVRAGVSIAIRDRKGETPLHKATLAHNLDCLRALLAPVKENPPRTLASVLNQKNYNGQACVHLAASAGHIDTLQTLVYYGADINSRENLAGWTALHIGARRGDVRVVQYLRERCAGVCARARDYAGRTPRRLARRSPAARAFGNLPDDSDTDSDDDDDYYDEDESLFENLQETINLINVA